MDVRMVYFGQARQFAGSDGEALRLDDGATLADALTAVAHSHGEAMAGLLLGDDGTPRRNLLLTVNGASRDAASAVALESGDEVAVVPPVSGG